MITEEVGGKEDMGGEDGSEVEDGGRVVDGGGVEEGGSGDELDMVLLVSIKEIVLLVSMGMEIVVDVGSGTAVGDDADSDIQSGVVR